MFHSEDEYELCKIFVVCVKEKFNYIRNLKADILTEL
jgi:hypothetical protein